VTRSVLEQLAIAGLDFSHIKVNLYRHDGNAFALIGTVRKALRRAGAPREAIDAFTQEATSGTYDDLLQTLMEWVDITCEDEDD